MRREHVGEYRLVSSVEERVRAFVPAPLPPEPPLVVAGELLELLTRAHLALGRLDGARLLLPNVDLFLYMYVRKEALVSSQIEGTQSSFSDLLMYESKEVEGVPLADVQEVSKYVAAMNHGLSRLADLPLCGRLLREIHGILLSKGRGSDKTPGEYRRSQNWIGGSRPGNALYVPPPADLVPECMGALEKFLHDETLRTPVLLKAAMAHVQFESIHPFLDGNGRLGRLLITLLLCADDILHAPLLYLSLYFKTHRQTYYELLQRVRTEGEWEEWVRFFLTGVIETATGAVDTAQRLVRLFEDDRHRLLGLGRKANLAVRAHLHLQRHPVVTATGLAKALRVSAQAGNSLVKLLEQAHVLREVSGRKWRRVYVYDQYIRILSEGTEPLPQARGRNFTDL